MSPQELFWFVEASLPEPKTNADGGLDAVWLELAAMLD